MNKLRFAVIGAGRMGSFHAKKLASMADVELAAVIDPNAEAAETLARSLGTAARTDYRPILRALDAAVVAAPSAAHHAIASDLLNAGVHVLVEKPLCPRRDEADDLSILAHRRGLVLRTGHVERFNPAFAAVRREIGVPAFISARRESPYTFRSTDVGVVLDLMIHDIDLVLQLVGGPVQRVDALGLSVVGPHEDFAEARIVFQSGCTAVLTASRVSHEAVRRMQLWRSDRFATIDFAARTARMVRPKSADEAGICFSRCSPAEVEQHKAQWLSELLPCEELAFEPVDALTLELRHFIDAVRMPRRQTAERETGREAVALAERIVEEIARHAWDDEIDGAVGPHARPAVPFVPQPRFAAETVAETRKAG